jgi:uncharacterized protein (TIGR03790 family)
MRVPVLCILLTTVAQLSACATPAEKDGTTHDEADDTAGEDDGLDTGADLACPSVLELTASSETAVPGGAAVALHVQGDVSITHVASVSWDATVGALEADHREAVWTVPGDEAVHTDAVATLTVTVGVPGCDSVSKTLDLPVGHPDSARVLVLWNPAFEGSEAVALAYAEAHTLPQDRLCPLTVSDPTVLPGDELEGVITELSACLDAAGPQVQVLVPVYGVPYKVSGRIEDLGTGNPATVSLDALLAFGENALSLDAAVYNPLYQDGDSPTATWDPYVPLGELLDALDYPFFVVARIEGVDTDAALDLITRAVEAQALADAAALQGRVYVDGRYGDTPPSTDDFGSYQSGEWNMWGMRQIFDDLYEDAADDATRFEVVWNGDDAEFGTEPAPLTCPDALFYSGWYSFNHYNDAFTWAPGAVGGHLDSCSACTLRGGPSWSSNALELGITATFGAVNEPYVAGMPEYDQLFLYLLQGASFGEAAYESTVVGAWMMVFVGDPLYRPFPGGVVE